MKNEYVIRDDGAAEISLTQGKVTLVDAGDLPLVAKRRWNAAQHKRGYWKATSGANPTVYMHRVLMDASGSQLVDHINHDTLDNRRHNLRMCTVSQNNANGRKRNGTSSRWKGVNWDKQNNKWRAQVSASGRRVNLGLFDDEEDAALAYDEAARREYREFAYLNFPPR